MPHNPFLAISTRDTSAMRIVRIALAGTDRGDQGPSLRLAANERHEARLAAIVRRLRRGTTLRVEVLQREAAAGLLLGVGLAVTHSAEVGHKVVHCLLQGGRCCANESE